MSQIGERYTKPPVDSVTARVYHGQRADHSGRHRCVCCNENVPSDGHRLHRLVDLEDREQFACALIGPNTVADVFQQFQIASTEASDVVLCRACKRKVEKCLSQCGSESFFSERVMEGNGENNPEAVTGKRKAKYLAFAIPAAVVGGVAAVIAAPVAVAAAGFGAGGIAAGSLAASMMSSAWTTGIGVGVVSTLQSVGAVGMSAALTGAVATAGGATGAGVGGVLAKFMTGKSQQQTVNIALCRIKVDNDSGFVLVQPSKQTRSGVVLFEPSDTVVPSNAGVMVVAEKTNTDAGFSGTVSWLIREMSRRVVVAWSFPFQDSPSKRWLAVGLTAPGVTSHAPGDIWFTEIDSEVTVRDLNYTRRIFGSGTCTVRDADFELEGTMPCILNDVVIKVILRPVCTEDVASSQMKKMTLSQVD